MRSAKTASLVTPASVDVVGLGVAEASVEASVLAEALAPVAVLAVASQDVVASAEVTEDRLEEDPASIPTALRTLLTPSPTSLLPAASPAT